MIEEHRAGDRPQPAAPARRRAGTRRVLMCRPDHFTVSYRINPWMHPTVPTDTALALRFLDPASPYAAARTAPFWAEVWARGGANWSLHGGQYTMTPDAKPLIGPSPVPGLWLSAGYGGHGVMQSTGGAKLLLDLIAGRRAPADNPFRPDRPMPAGELRPL